jgi:hypothetical protein
MKELHSLSLFLEKKKNMKDRDEHFCFIRNKWEILFLSQENNVFGDPTAT